MNKELYTIAEVGEIKEISNTDESLTIVAEKKIELATEHDSDCCEHVYGDFSIMKYHLDSLRGKVVRNLVVKAVEGLGFLLVFEIGYNEDVKIFIACYNYQNGYYSDNLSLAVKTDELRVDIDISECVEDHID